MKNKYLLLLLIVLLCSCAKDVLDRTIFIPDEEDYNLPAYTEWGYNTFGAEYERDYFLVSNKITPCKIVYKENYLQFSLSGTIRGGKEMSLLFIFPANKMNDYRDLLRLHKMNINLSANECIVKILYNKEETVLNVSEGELNFKRVQLLSVDDIENRVILSGTFYLHFLENELPSFITNGRFDLGITNKFFFTL
jgi:hypothetical protein